MPAVHRERKSFPLLLPGAGLAAAGDAGPAAAGARCGPGACIVRGRLTEFHHRRGEAGAALDAASFTGMAAPAVARSSTARGTLPGTRTENLQPPPPRSIRAAQPER